VPNAFYEMDNGEIATIRLSAAYLAEAGTPPAGPATTNLKVKVSKTNREFGIRPRGVRLGRVQTSGPLTKTFYGFLPVLTAAAWNSSAYDKGTIITLNGVAWQAGDREGEDS
jgi:hypothetical protein